MKLGNIILFHSINLLNNQKGKRKTYWGPGRKLTVSCIIGCNISNQKMNNNFNMDNLKAQSHLVLSKLLSEIDNQKKEDEKNNLTNPENEPVTLSCQQLLNLHSHNLHPKQKLLLQIALTKSLQTQMTRKQFKQRITKMINETHAESNQFDLPFGQIPKSIVNIDTPQKSEEGSKGRNKKLKKKVLENKTEGSVEFHPEYYKVDLDMCVKIFDSYKSLPLGIPQHGGNNFEEKQYYKTSMNYHKILELFKDAKINLQINQKLMILRSIKKFSFNQNFINLEQFIKVFKVIIHGLGFKEQVFQSLVKKKNFDRESKEKYSVQKGRKNYRFKTDGSAPTMISQINSSKNLDFSNLDVKIDPKERRKDKNQKLGKIQQQDGGRDPSYLAKAMENQKIGKITWQSLFNMKQNSAHTFIVIPKFIKDADLDQF